MPHAAHTAMTTLMMLDDDLLFRRDNTIRRYGDPQLAADAVYADPHFSTVWPSPWVFRLADGRYRMLYLGGSRQNLKQHWLLGAISADGVHFAPEDYTGQLPDSPRIAGNAIMPLGEDEIGTIFEDPYAASPDERYRMLTTRLVTTAKDDPEVYYARTIIHVSGDLLHWTCLPIETPMRTEPLMSAFHNHDRKCMTLVHRPWCGVRKVGIRQTTDWRHYSDYELVMQADAMDAPLSEIYGMTAFPYHGIYLGLPHIYSGANPGRCLKFFGGTIQEQLAYSMDGRHWFRSLRTPFISGGEGRGQGLPEYKLVWATSVREFDDGGLAIYACASEYEHGAAFHNPDARSCMLVYRLRKDGFVRLATADPGKPSVVAIRECIWHGGHPHWNLRAANATVAVYGPGHDNSQGYLEPVAGFSHDDCIPFTGDSTDWTPQYRGRQSVESLAGNILCFEIRFEKGDLYSFSGNATIVFAMDAARYFFTGRMPGR